ncbi:MAG TPA: hypothetical protein VIP46_02615 [Pyrinomonadaceae bacterium]
MISPWRHPLLWLKQQWGGGKSLRRVNGVDVPETGRSSAESDLSDRITQSLQFWGGVSPVIDFQMLAVLKHLWVFNPDMSQYVANVVNMANTGHKLHVTASSKRRTEQAADRLNEAATRLYRIGAGVDGLMNAYLAQAAVLGAVSSEDVVNLGARRVERVALVPVEQIRFKFIEGEYVPHQRPGVGAGMPRSPLGLIRLSPETYRYYAVQTIENSPYAKPPATAAVASITGPQTDMLDNIRFIARKLGLLGIVSISVARPPEEANESPEQYRGRLRRYLAEVGKAAEQVSNTGLLVTYDDQKVQHDRVTGDSRGAYDVFRMNEEQVFSGLGTFPAFHGRTDSTTETYANVVYNFMLSQAANFQRVIKRRHEHTCRLDLRLGGVPFDGVSMQFNREKARNPLQQAQADRINDERSIKKAEKGIISPDEAAREMGYDSAFDPQLLVADKEGANRLRQLVAGRPVRDDEETITLQFDPGSHSYRYVPRVIYLSAAEPGARP